MSKYCLIIIGLDARFSSKVIDSLNKRRPEVLIYALQPHDSFSLVEKKNNQMFEWLNESLNQESIIGIGAFIERNYKHKDFFKKNLSMSSFTVCDLDFTYAPDIDTENRFSKFVNDLILLFENEIEEIKKSIIFLNNEFICGYSKTPLLLPFTSYNIREMRTLAEDVFTKLHRNEDKKNAIKKIKNKFDYNNKKVKVSIENNKELECYTGNGMIFKSPGKHKHGVKKLGLTGTHIRTCFVSAIFRFGSKIVDGFHYDCTNLHGGNVNKKLINCCGKGENYKNKYINIYPNDFIRTKK